MRRTRVKFCGITCKEDALAAASLGVDAIGMVFYPAAKTAVRVEEAARIAADLPPLVDVVALFVNPTDCQVRHVIRQVRPQWLQFHGQETESYCAQFNMPYLKAYDAHRFASMTVSHKQPMRQAILLDSAVGGSGTSFNWSLLSAVDTCRVMVAGGLGAHNVGALVRCYRPLGVDVSSGISSSSERRKKDRGKMADFMRAVRDADAT